MQINYNGMCFESPEEFATYLNINQHTARTYLSQGMAPEALAEHAKVLAPMTAARQQGQPFDQQALREQPFGQLTPNLKSRLSTGQGVITENTNPQGRRVPCVVGGIEYASHKQAATAHGLPLQTVFSRMSRNHMSFEEAVLMGSREQRIITPVPELLGTKGQWNKVASFEKKASMEAMRCILAGAGFICELYASDGIKAIKSSTSILGTPVEFFVIHSETDEYCEVVVSKLMHGDPALANRMNNSTAGMRFRIDKNDIMSASTGSIFRRTGANAKLLLREVYRLFGACEQAMILGLDR